ncbi:hypothetical protein PUNSTDRAFT_134843 [Punctularia strigosozonata HHB-11173 SS5]|uniref:uncharacterized protein n=1 Tax=Punctularia strigosozonata (strain HHB-11173) TaxID=741275 RepID=UPI0004417041|nr:uncharacterized protein PUNSTDRAFT_134843 [Punctularia strigosozonata HHB-11173 SS5]EIN08464.1 hypothetical protein PUNSTDRAFT_134843 [Punctularia strigosozonata HHB-11173 SS5]
MRRRSLPQELVDNIIDFVTELEADHGNNTDPTLLRRSAEDLRALSCVCRAMRKRSQKHLFQKLIVNSSSDCERLRTVLNNDPLLSGHVKSLYVRSYDQHRFKALPDDALRAVIDACRRVESLSLQDFDEFTRWPGAYLMTLTFPVLLRLKLNRCTVSNYDDLAIVLVKMPELRELRLNATCIECIFPSDMWTKRARCLRALELRQLQHFVTGPTTAGAFARGFEQVENLDIVLHSLSDYMVLCNLSIPGTGVENLTLAVNWNSEKPPQDLCTDFGDDPTRGEVLRSLTLQESATETGLRMISDGRWASNLLLALPGTHLERVCVRLEYHQSGEPWYDFDWAAVDGALGCATRFSALREVTMEIRERCAQGCKEEDGHSVDDPFILAVKERLPKVTGRDKLTVKLLSS